MKMGWWQIYRKHDYACWISNCYGICFSIHVPMHKWLVSNRYKGLYICFHVLFYISYNCFKFILYVGKSLIGSSSSRLLLDYMKVKKLLRWRGSWLVWFHPRYEFSILVIDFMFYEIEDTWFNHYYKFVNSSYFIFHVWINHNWMCVVNMFVCVCYKFRIWIQVAYFDMLFVCVLWPTSYLTHLKQF